MTVQGHPSVAAITPEGREIRITVCAECGELSTILWLTKDRWYCRNCRTEGAGRAEKVPISNPARRR